MVLMLLKVIGIGLLLIGLGLLALGGIQRMDRR